MNRLSIPTLSPSYAPQVEKGPFSSSMALIEILSSFHEKVSTINQLQGLNLKSTSENLDEASKQFLEDLKALFETQKSASAAEPFFKSFQYIASFINIGIGAGLCATGVASVVGSVIIATGVFGCIHTTLELTDSYKHLACLTDDRATQDIIKSYIPALISTSLVLSSALTGSYSTTLPAHTAAHALRLFGPMIIQSLTTSQVIAKGVFDLHKHNAESKKIDHEALKLCLETILEEQQDALSQTMKSRSHLNQETLAIIKTLSSLFKQS